MNHKPAVMAVAADQTSASCSCGWKSDYFGVELQQQIQDHYSLECSNGAAMNGALAQIAHSEAVEADEVSRQQALKDMKIPAVHRFMWRLIPDWMFAQRYPELA